MQKVAATVITYNRKALLAECVKALLCQSVSCDIIIIDNASTDGTGEMVRAIVDPRISYINTGSNLGGAGGFNYGMRKAVEAGYDYGWLMDDDTIVKGEANIPSLIHNIEKVFYDVDVKANIEAIGRAPIAAISLKFTVNAFRASSAAEI